MNSRYITPKVVSELNGDIYAVFVDHDGRDLSLREESFTTFTEKILDKYDQMLHFEKTSPYLLQIYKIKVSEVEGGP